MYEIERIRAKSERMMDSYFSGILSKEEMERYRRRYTEETEVLHLRIKAAENRTDAEESERKLRTEIRNEVLALFRGERESRVFYRSLLDRITVYRDGHVTLQLNQMPKVYVFEPVPHC